MSERTPSHASPALPASDLGDLLDRATRLPDGLALLRGAPLECAAILLGVAPTAIERARLALQDPRILSGAAARLQGRASDWRPASPPRPPLAPRDPQQLLHAARQRADGLGLLLSAAPEAAAIAFGVHPDLVHGARAVAAGTGDLPRR